MGSPTATLRAVPATEIQRHDRAVQHHLSHAGNLAHPLGCVISDTLWLCRFLAATIPTIIRQASFSLHGSARLSLAKFRFCVPLRSCPATSQALRFHSAALSIVADYRTNLALSALTAQLSVWTLWFTLCRFTDMVGEPRLSAQTLKVLGALMSSTRDELSGADIGRGAKLASGTLYPILSRLEASGWLASRWEVEAPSELGRPRRRYYRITSLGLQSFKKEFQSFEPVFKVLKWV